jgi:glucosamine kinase
MVLIADSGSTKTDWRLIQDGQIRPFRSEGINPFFQDDEQISGMLKQDFAPALGNTVIKEVHFYGAGCAVAEKALIVEKALKNCFGQAEIRVATDILGAARALCGSEKGVACILGTGSNSCYYDGDKITDNVPSFGYLFGDHGSGADIGKTLVQLWADGELPPELRQRFEERQGNSRENILERVYRQPFPNRFLAAYSKFVFQHLAHPFMTELVKNCFHRFFETQVEKYSFDKRTPVHATGSIAFYFNSVLKNVAEERGIQMGTIVEAPIAALTLYHLERK